MSDAALDSVAQWVEEPPVYWKIAGSIPSEGTSLGCGFDP